MKNKITIIIPVYNQEELLIKALENIPNREDIEIIVIDDASTDNTWNNLLKYRENTNKNIVCLYNKENKGVAYTVNKGLDNATGEYIVLLGSDDYFYTEQFEKCINMINNEDLIYFNLQTNDGTIFKVNNDTKYGYCGSVKFMKRSFIDNIRNIDVKYGEDYYFFRELMKKKPKEKFTNLVVKHYNYPRENSLSYEQRKANGNN